MPLRVTDQTHWCHEHRRSALGAEDTAGLRGFDWELWLAAIAVRDRRGRERDGSATGPGSFSWLAAESRHNFGTKKN